MAGVRMRWGWIASLMLVIVGCAHAPKREPASSVMPVMMDPSIVPACATWNDKVTSEQQDVINRMMASREHRIHHALWHSVRGGLNANEQTSVVSTFGPSWSQFHPLCPAPEGEGAKYNPVGEDFLYMHRQMLNMLRQGFVDAGLPCVTGWDHIPSTTEWPLPDRVTTGPKSPQTLRLLQAWDQRFRSAEWLKSHSLSEVGWALEYSLHNNLHMRYATELPPKGFSVDGAPITFDGNFPAGWLFDDPRYNWLADPYGAAVNPTFWKIHGYVDSIIDQWLLANGYEKIAVDCAGSANCYTWRGRWTGEIALGLPRAPKSPTPRKPTPDEERAIRKLTRRRMDIQRLGVLKESDFAQKSPISADPYEYARASLCN